MRSCLHGVACKGAWFSLEHALARVNRAGPSQLRQNRRPTCVHENFTGEIAVFVEKQTG